MKRITKAIIPTAGMGTRVQSLTKDQPKEMLPIGGRPMISYAVQEAALSGLTELFIVINARKASLRRYLESEALQGALRSEKRYQDISLPRLTFIDQPSPVGSGDAIYQARDLIGEEPFALMMPDFVFFGDTPALGQMISLYEQCERHIVGLLTLRGEEAEGFGNVGIVEGEEREQGVVEIHSLSGKTPDPLIVKEGEKVFKAVARWILEPHFFSYLERTKGKGEWDDTPALQMLCREKEVLGKVLEGRGFDVGTPVGYQAATVFAANLDVGGKR